MLYCAGGGYGGTLTAGTGACGRNLVTETQPGGSPTVLRMILARQLQALREKAGMSYEQAGEAIYSSEWTIRRMERAEGGLKPLTVKSLLMAYGVTDPGEIGAFLALARDATKPGWWHSYDDVLPSEGYIRAITAASFPAASGEFTERAVALRLARQHLLTRPEPPQYWVVLDETVLRRPVGGRKVMRAQLEHLIAAAEQPRITIQVIPFAAGWHPALYGMFNIFRFPAAQLPDIVYTEALTGAYYLNKPEESARYTEALDRMCAQAASPEHTVTILREIMKET